MYRSGLVLLCPEALTHHRLRCLLSAAYELVRDTLYVHVAPPGVASARLAREVYAHRPPDDRPDVRVLLPMSSCPRVLSAGCNVVLTSGDVTSSLEYVIDHFKVESQVDVRSFPDTDSSDGSVAPAQATEDGRTFSDVVVGGTFDRLHAGHKLLLSEASARATSSLTVGVTDGRMNEKKILHELMLPLASRMSEVESFLRDIKPSLTFDLTPITDPYGPSIVNPELQALVVSEETVAGGERVNVKRVEKGMNPLELITVDLLPDACRSPDEEEKISSSSCRRRLLGTLRRELRPPGGHLVNYAPYIVGLTGGMASGKSSVCRRLAELGAAVIDCDQLGHRTYQKDSETFNILVSTFGREIVGDDGEVDRKVLGAKVFSDPSELHRLNEIVWPAIGRLVTAEIERVREGAPDSVVVLDAAVLLEAGWESLVHEVWTTVLPTDEAVSRIVARNRLSEDQALGRLAAQLTNQQRVMAADVVLCTMWQPDVTQRQVEKAWRLLEGRSSAKKQEHLNLSTTR